MRMIRGWVLVCLAVGCSSGKNDHTAASLAPPPPSKPLSASEPPRADPSPSPSPSPTEPTPTTSTTPVPKGGHDFAAQATLLFRVAACGSKDSPVPAGYDAKLIDRHCAALHTHYDRYSKKWIDVAKPYLADVVPDTLPKTLVYPFGGGDLMTALATFPDATEITTISLEYAGDVRNIETMKKDKLGESLDTNRENLRRLMAVAHSKTTNLSIVVRGELPGQLIFSMAAMVLHGFEPVSLRYFTLEADGSIHYLAAEEIAAAEAAAKKQSKKEELQLFANAEIEYVPAGKPDAPRRVFRHLAWNLDDDHLGRDPQVIKHLESKGKVAAMTKAASFLLWWESFSTIRNYLLAHMEWMISDATGILPEHASTAGFEQETYGVFRGPFLPGAGKKGSKQMIALWNANPKKPLPFRYGYPDNARHAHMMVTRRVPK